jgi:hypothetical protein
MKVATREIEERDDGVAIEECGELAPQPFGTAE